MNIHILPTYKASRLQKTKYGNLFLVNKFKSYDNCTPQHIYITDDKEIKPNEWYENNGVIFKADTPFDEGNNPNNSNPRVTDFNKKIILTTDPQLIEDGIQEIDETFLEWYVKNPSCESVDVEKENICARCHSNDVDECWSAKECSDGRYDKKRYKIIIPKEEPKQENCCTPIGQIKRYMNCVGCDRKPQQETLEQSYQRGYERGLNVLLPLIENLEKQITELKRNLYIR
jgi:hypothetical protein